ncbi:MAG: hypothetical protein ACYDDA_16175 [Acidiferrobacteraceae bacterium]
MNETMNDNSDVLLALGAVGTAIEQAGEEGAGPSQMVGLGTAVRLLAGMLSQDEPLPDRVMPDEDRCLI